MSDSPPEDAVRSDFIEQTGLISQAEGLPRIAGRVFGLLIFDGDAVSFGDLAKRLQVSRGSISSSIRILEERGLIKRTSKPGVRQDYLQLAPNPYATMLAGIQKRNRVIKDDIAQTINRLPADADAVKRLQNHANFYASLDAAIGLALSELDKTDTGRKPAPSKDKAHGK
jgi:DNA-binding transcriptional regulator GbsR (MarR family)